MYLFEPIYHKDTEFGMVKVHHTVPRLETSTPDFDRCSKADSYVLKCCYNEILKIIS